ncbi:MAG: metalloregulator ArsR/SmtB family transcription factor [Bacteroidota bacterium]
MSKPTKELLPPLLIDRVARRFKLLSEPVRLQLLSVLHREKELTVQELVEATGQHQANVSKHLNLMAKEGILSRNKEGLFVYYAIKDTTISGLCLLVSGRIRQEIEQEQRRLKALS